MHKLESVIENETQGFFGFWDAKRSPNPSQKTRPSERSKKKKKKKKEKKKRTYRIVHFAELADPRVKIKETKKKVMYLDFVKELPPPKKKLWNIRMKVIPIITGAFGTFPKGLVRELEELKIEGRTETIQTNALIRLARILWRVLEMWGDLLLLQWKIIS